ncbi:MAG TPA: hypothetical protein VLE89_02510, partial [Chlamydiales bacterium]|nr:hypothetical protein [Chlamydiales bacterium]
TAAVAVPATLLAASIGPPIATATGCGALYLISRSSELKEKVKTLFRRLPDETPENARSRIRKNIRNAILGTCVFSGLVGTAAYFLSDVFQSNTYSITLRSQTDAVVFAEYGVLALGHLAFAKGRYQNKQKIAAIYYFLNALISVGFPIAYFKTYDHNGPLRLHHSWIGQALQLLPGVNSKILGAALSLDSLNYIATTPGYTEFQMDSAGTICQVYSPYGLDNIVVENFEAVMKSISIGCGLEFLGFLLKDRAPTIEPDSHPSVRNLPEIENSQPSPTPSQYDSIPSPVDSGIV